MAPEPVVDEDDWEWTIAIARARAAAEEAELAAAQAARSAPRRRGDTVPPPVAPAPRFVAAKTLPIAKVAASPPSDPIARDAWEQTQPLTDLDLGDTTSPTVRVVLEKPMPSLATNKHVVVKPAPVDIEAPPPLGIPTPPKPFPAVAQPRQYARAPSPVTVIPIPKLPKAEPSRIAPVVKPARLAKGTGPVTPPSDYAAAEKTLPSLILPPAAKVVALPRVVARK